MRLPDWLRKNQNVKGAVHDVKRDLRRRGLHTVCEEARCPNKGECFQRGTATFLIMGDVCTRSCGFCSVRSGLPKALDPDEPENVAMQVREMDLRHAVITSVTRDDLLDGGAAHFAKTILAIKETCPQTTIEVLTPDLEGRAQDIRTVCDAGPDIFNHNVETVERLTPDVRNKASYRRSLEVLKTVMQFKGPPIKCRTLNWGTSMIVKSGLMIGLGETEEEVITTLIDLKNAGCHIVTIGQYLQPTKRAVPVVRYVHPDEFKKYELKGRQIGIKHMFCGPFVRSSYMAERGSS